MGGKARKPASQPTGATRKKGPLCVSRSKAKTKVLLQLADEIKLGTQYRDMVAMVEKAGFSTASAKNWIREVRAGQHAKAKTDAGQDFDKKRWARIALYDRRSKMYMELADAEESWQGKAGLEKQCRGYEDMLAKAMHWYSIPPDRDMELPEVQSLVATSLVTYLPKFPLQERLKVLRCLLADLQDAHLSEDAQRDVTAALELDAVL
jgi:hypothetical protein